MTCGCSAKFSKKLVKRKSKRKSKRKMKRSRVNRKYLTKRKSSKSKRKSRRVSNRKVRKYKKKSKRKSSKRKSKRRKTSNKKVKKSKRKSKKRSKSKRFGMHSIKRNTLTAPKSTYNTGIKYLSKPRNMRSGRFLGKISQPRFGVKVSPIASRNSLKKPLSFGNSFRAKKFSNRETKIDEKDFQKWFNNNSHLHFIDSNYANEYKSVHRPPSPRLPRLKPIKKKSL